MKKTFTKFSIIALSIISLNAHAQIKLGATAGAQLSFSSTDIFKDVKSIASPTFGIVAQFDLGAGFMFRPSVNYIQDGFKSLESVTTQIAPTIKEVIETSSTLKMQSLQLPLDFVVGIKAGTGKFLVSLAPVVTIGLSSSLSVTETETTTGQTPQSSTASFPVEFSGTNAVFKRLDWGGKFGIGYEFKNGLQLNAAYKAGLNNLSVKNDAYKNNNLSLTLSYFFIK
jgi:hypothetical protein